MLGPFDYIIAALGFCAELYLVVRLLAGRSELRYFALATYMLAMVLGTAAQYFFLQKFGFQSSQYLYCYYYSDALLTIALFFVIMSFYHQVFQQMGVRKYVHGASIILLSATAAFSYLVVHQNSNNLTTHFVVEMGRNFYFVGVVLTYLLWGAILKLKETRIRLVQLVLALGIYYSADAATYALRNLFPAFQPEFLKFIPPVLGAFLPLAWAYTFTKIPEEARLLTARLAPSHQS